MVPTIKLSELVPVLSVKVNTKQRMSTITVQAGPYTFKAFCSGIYNELNAKNYFRQYPQRFIGPGAELAKYVSTKL